MTIASPDLHGKAAFANASPSSSPTENPVIRLLDRISEYGLQTDEVLKVQWSDMKVFGGEWAPIKTLVSSCKNDDGQALQTRLNLTRELLKNSPSMEALSSRINKACNGEDSNQQATVSNLIDVHLAAKEKIEKSRDNVFFSFLYLAKMTIKSEITDRLRAALASKSMSSEEARDAAFSKAVNREARTLLKSHIFPPSRNQGPAPAETVNISKGAEPAFNQFKLLMEKLPAHVRQHENWPNIEKRMTAYFNHTIKDQGVELDKLMRYAANNFGSLLNSMEVSCNLDADTAHKLAFRRELWNIGQNQRPTARQNQQVTGWAESFANQSVKPLGKGKVPDILKPGNQLSLAVDTPMIREDGEIVDVTILSFIGPALDSPDQPEYSQYAEWRDQGPNGFQGASKFYPEAFQKAYSTIRSQALAYARSHPEKNEFAITGVGLDAYLQGLIYLTAERAEDRTFKDAAQQIGTSILAELTVELRKMGRTVIFTDKDSFILKKVNEHLNTFASSTRNETDPSLTAPVKLAGKIPGNWINEGTVIFNAWDTHSLLGNKQKNDKSIDGFIGRNTLIHSTHALRCALEAEGISLH